MALRLMNWMNLIFWLGTVALILITVTGCNEAKSVHMVVNTAIESPLRNSCQSGDLDPTFSKCQDEDSPTFTSSIPSLLSRSAASAK
jgi:hypothetical protein